MFECAEVSADGVVRPLGCFADDGTTVSRDEMFAALDALPSTDEFMAAACPPGSPERAALPDRWLVRLLRLGERRAAALAADRAEVIGLLATQRPAADAPAVPEVMDVSEWLPCELALVHPYGERRAGRLIRTSLALTGRFRATLDALRRGDIGEEHADAVVDLLEPLDADLAARVEADVLPRAGGQTPARLSDSLRRRIDRLDPAARERRHQRARAAADVRWWATEDGMGRLMGDPPLPEAAACGTAIDAWARRLREAGDRRPIGQLRAEVLGDLVLRPWERRPGWASRSSCTRSCPRWAAGTSRQRWTGTRSARRSAGRCGPRPTRWACGAPRAGRSSSPSTTQPGTWPPWARGGRSSGAPEARASGVPLTPRTTARVRVSGGSRRSATAGAAIRTAPAGWAVPTSTTASPGRAAPRAATTSAACAAGTTGSRPAPAAGASGCCPAAGSR
ncbi:DUF222 domain-containing protein [Geodermatophilus normandii]|uniref:DUF222 domain-containing protein n=1 Tax=Geodermatophilus normandii TaxID=1137989 RepID=A0A6P0GKQ6_9ACTN|nr:DUF222 domain-containing protein [Geodermatophilus normandii]